MLPEDDAVDAAELRFQRVDDLVVSFEVGLDLPAELDQPGDFTGRDALFEEGVERTAESDVDGAPRGLEAAGVHVGGHVAEAHGFHIAVLDARDRLQPSRGTVDDDARLRLGRVDDAALDRPRDERDRAVAARGRVARVVEEDDAEVGAIVLRLRHKAAVHVGVAARLVDEQAANVVDVLEGVAPLVEDRAARVEDRRRR